MIILGVYAGHDSNACLVKDGVVLGHVESERTTRMKHQQGIHRGSIEGLMRYCGAKMEDVDGVAIGGTTVLKGVDEWTELETAIRAAGEEALKRFVYPQLFGSNGESEARTITGEFLFEGRNRKLWLTDHHLSHAALAYYTSPFTDAKVISWDGGGDGAYVMIAHGKGNKLGPVFYNPPSGACVLSIGGAWTELGKLYGEGVGSGVDYEGKIMGHAAYGVAEQEMVDIVKLYIEEYQLLSPRIKEVIKKQIRLMAYLGDFKEPSCMTFSASLQKATEDVMMEIAEKYVMTNEALCLTGGCAYNCVANGRLWQKYPRMFVTNIPHDGGLSIGSALYVWHHLLNNGFNGIPLWSPYTGLGTGEVAAFSDKRVESIASQVVKDLLAGKIVAWHDGRSEGGKRALGNRSILMDPRIRDGKEILNNKVKKREWFRPFAPSIQGSVLGIPPSPYMSFSCKVPDLWLSSIPGVMHVDGSCRPQIVTYDLNPAYYRILQLWEEATGIPILLNTSLNIREPICDTPEDSVRTFKMANGGIDVLYVNGERQEW